MNASLNQRDDLVGRLTAEISSPPIGRDTMTLPIRVLITDGHKVIRQGLKMLLNLDPEIEVVDEAENGAETIERARLLHPDVVLMDLLTPVKGAIEAIARLRAELTDTEVIVMTSVLESAAVIGAVRGGAIGYLLRDTDAKTLCRAIKAPSAGRVQLAPEAAAHLMREVRAAELKGADSGEALTKRETDVLRLLAKGRANKEIAVELGIGEKTVKTHVSSIRAKLGVQSRIQAALQATRLGLIDQDEIGEGHVRSRCRQ